MDLALTESELALRDSVRQFVRHEASIPVLTGLSESPQPWRRDWLPTFAAAGWLGLFVPGELGGAGATTMDMTVLMEELGRGPVPGPVLPSSVVSALLLRSAAAGPARDELLAGIAAGTHVVIPALREPGASWQGAGSASADLVGDGRLTCTKLFAAYADAATHFLVSLAPASSGQSRFAVVPAGEAGVSARGLPGFLHASYAVDFSEVPVPSSQVLHAPGVGGLDAALAPGLVALAAYQAGGCQAVLDMSIEYASSREQFGMPIGRFQRVQDHIVRILNAADTARWAAYEAAWALDSGQPGAPARAHLAASVASESYIEAANAGHEVHAGIGSDPKYGLTLFTQESRSLFEFLGSPDWHRARLADGLGWAS
jgi:alkylation response protein AidB-like acyl-CoA dehydrogenase